MVRRDTADPETVTDEVAVTRTVNAETLKELNSFDDALQALADAGIMVTDVSEYGDGFEVIDEKDKGQLVGVPFVVLGASLADGDYGKFVSLRIMTRDGRKIVLNDGSTGIKDQVANDIGMDRVVGTGCKHGLRASRYMFCESCKAIGKENMSSCPQCGTSPMKPAATYYLDTSK